MKSKMRYNWLSAVMLATALWLPCGTTGRANAAQGPLAERRPVPALALSDLGGNVSTLAALQVAGTRQVILIVDATLPSAGRALDALNAKELVGAIPVLVLISGSDSEVQSLKNGRDAATNWRWWRIASRAQLRQSGLKGMPILIGAEGDGSIGFSYFGLPRSGDRYSQLVQDWIQAGQAAGAQAGGGAQ